MTCAPEPPIRARYLDPDFRRDPRTNHYCCACQKDLKQGRPYRRAMVAYSGFYVIHPDQWAEAPSAPPYCGHAAEAEIRPIGLDCAARLGLDWTRGSDEESGQ